MTSSWGVPLVPFKLYKVDDGTGEVTVLSQSGRTPTEGAHVRVTGRVNDVATFGGQASACTSSREPTSTSRRGSDRCYA